MATLTTAGYAPVNGISMYYEVYGEGGVPLVLLHGGGSTIQITFGNMLPLLATHNQLIAVELQAHGRTSDRDAPESFEQDADDVAELLKYLGVHKVNILGFSNGGSTALQIAIRHGELANKIVAISAATKRDGLLPGLFDGLQHATPDHMPAALKEAYLQIASQEQLQTMFEKDRQRMLHFKDWPDEDLQHITAPTLVMSADKDVILPEHSMQMARLIPNAQLAILPATHGTMIGEVGTTTATHNTYEITAALVNQFLNSPMP